MLQEETLRILRKVGALVTESHIVYTSGKHGSAYINKDAIYPHTKITSRLCFVLAKQFADDNVGTVIAPAIGGVILSHRVADYLTDITGSKVFGVFAEKASITVSEPGEALGLPLGEYFVIKRGYDKFIANQNVLVVEDVLTTGGSARKVIETVRAHGGKIVGLGVLCNRGDVTAQDVGNPPKLLSLVSIKLDSWDEAECPLCDQGVPINTDVGKGREFLARRKLIKE